MDQGEHLGGELMATSVVVEHLNEMMADLRKLDKTPEAKARLKAGNYTAAQAVAIAAAQRAPRLSGKLAYSIRPRATATGAEVRISLSQVPYAGAIHFGWAKHNIEPNPFVFSAAKDLQAQIVEVFQAVVDRLAEMVNAST